MSYGEISPKLKGKRTLPIDISYPLGLVENTSNNQWIIKGAETGKVNNGVGSGGSAGSNIAIGYNAYASFSTSDTDGSIAIGSNAVATNAGAIRIGHASNYNDFTQRSGAKGAYSVVIGSNAYCLSSYSTVIGVNSYTTTTSGVAIGNGCSTTQTNTVAIGASASANGSQSIAIGNGSSIGCFTSFANSVAIGNAVSTEFVGELSYQQGCFSSVGDAKVSWFQMFRETSNAIAAELGTGTTISVTPTNRIILANDSTYLFDVDVVARNTTTDAESKVWNLKFGIRRGANVAATTLIGTPSKTVFGEDIGTSTWDISVTADTTNGRPNISVAGEAAKTIRWVANVRLTKVTG